MPSHNRKDFLRCGIRDDLEAVSIDTCYLRSALRSIKDNTQTDISEAIRVERERNAKTLADLARAVQTILPEIAGFERREQKDMQRAAELRQEVMKMQETFDTVARRHNTGLSARTDMLLEIDALTQESAGTMTVTQFRPPAKHRWVGGSSSMRCESAVAVFVLILHDSSFLAKSGWKPGSGLDRLSRV